MNVKAFFFIIDIKIIKNTPYNTKLSFSITNLDDVEIKLNQM